MGLFKKTREEKLEKYQKGIDCTFIIGEVVGNDYSAGTRMAATATFGLMGLAATSGTGVHKREMRGKIRLAQKGVVLSSYGLTDIRIPYSDILHAEKSLILGRGLILVSGEKVDVNPSDSEILDVIGERACGQVEEGW